MKRFGLRAISITFAALVALSISACSSGSDSGGQPKAAEELVTELKTAGLPIDNIIVYDEKTDVNELLGRPNQYISKVNFADTTVEQPDDKENPVGGTIETFNNAADLKSRKEYVEEITKSSPLFSQYIYVNGNYLLRIDHDVTPENAKKYEEAFGKLK